MPLSLGRLSLFGAISAAYDAASSAGVAGDPPASIIEGLATDLGNAIHDYMISAQVDTTVKVDPGQTCAAAPTSPSPGSYSTPGSGTGVGSLSFGGPSVDALRAQIEAALHKVASSGSQDGADSEKIIEELGKELAAAIHDFATSALVETNVTVLPGVAILGYTTTSAPPVPMPAASLPGTGKGEGNLS